MNNNKKTYRDPQANVNVNFRVIATYHSIDYKLKRHRIKIRWKKFHDLISTTHKTSMNYKLNRSIDICSSTSQRCKTKHK
jgi:hypothetical protein